LARAANAAERRQTEAKKAEALLTPEEAEAWDSEAVWGRGRAEAELLAKYADKWDAYSQVLWRKVGRTSGRTDFALERSLVYLMDVLGHEAPTFYNLSRLRRRTCYSVQKIPIACRYGLDLWCYEMKASVAARVAAHGQAAAERQ
jgi:hypothetical protein